MTFDPGHWDFKEEFIKMNRRVEELEKLLALKIEERLQNLENADFTPLADAQLGPRVPKGEN